MLYIVLYPDLHKSMEVSVCDIRPISLKQCFLLGIYVFIVLILCSLKSRTLFPREGRQTEDGLVMEYPPRSKGIWKKPRPLSFDLNPVNGTNITIIHNAVPKTGSRALELLVRKFTFRYKDKITCKESFPPEIADNSEKINEFVQSLEQGSYLRGHFPFQSFSESDVNVAFINIVRPPIERLQSNYYFDLYGDGESNPQNNAVYHQPTIDECIKNDVCFRKVYSYYRGSTLKTFCGHDIRCTKNTRWTLERAKENSRKYLMIGLTSQWSTTVRVLEILLPDLLNGLSTLMLEETEKAKSTFRTAKKIPLKNETLEFLKRDMSLENEFYRFVQEGFETATRLLLRNRTTVERTQ